MVSYERERIIRNSDVVYGLTSNGAGARQKTTSNSEFHPSTQRQHEAKTQAGTDEMRVSGSPPKKRKARKSTFVVRKEEKASLLAELQTLEKYASCLRWRKAGGEFIQKQHTNVLLRHMIRGHHLVVASTQSIVSGLLVRLKLSIAAVVITKNTDQTNPLSTSIHLGADWDERRRVLTELKEQNLLNASTYIATRSHLLDPLKLHRSDERFETERGDYCWMHFDVRRFENVSSVKQVYDAFMQYFMNVEITISEQLGHITVRDDCDHVNNKSVFNVRFLSSVSDVMVESNAVLFAKYSEGGDDGLVGNGGPYGIITIDAVDQDDLFPYTPRERVRKDAVMAMVFTPHMRKRRDGKEGEELVVVLSQGKFIKLHRPEFEVSSGAMHDLQEEIARWGRVMVKSVDEILSRARSEQSLETTIIPVHTSHRFGHHSHLALEEPMTLTCDGDARPAQVDTVDSPLIRGDGDTSPLADSGSHGSSSEHSSCVESRTKSPDASSWNVLTLSGLVDTDPRSSKRRLLSADPVRRPRQRLRPRKSTFTARKEEKELLVKEMTVLEARLQYLREQAQAAGAPLKEQENNNDRLRDTIRAQQISMATTQSVASGFLHHDQTNPLYSFIHLGSDPLERRQTLLRMKDMKLQNAYEYLVARSRYIDPLKPHVSIEKYEDALGHPCCARFDVDQFYGVTSVKQVYDALLQHMMNIEITVTEKLDQLTVREDYDYVENNIANYRLLSIQNGLCVESNGVFFAKFYQSHEHESGSACGVVAVDNVDEDTLYPYQPSERVRKDVRLAIMLTQCMRKKRDGEDGEELVVSVSRGKFLKLHQDAKSRNSVSSKEMLADWGDVMVNAIREALHLPHASR
ncbi:hypothetical protein FI667_g7622, partial [Globisporangium splendens]